MNYTQFKKFVKPGMKAHCNINIYNATVVNTDRTITGCGTQGICWDKSWYYYIDGNHFRSETLEDGTLRVSFLQDIKDNRWYILLKECAEDIDNPFLNKEEVRERRAQYQEKLNEFKSRVQFINDTMFIAYQYDFKRYYCGYCTKAVQGVVVALEDKVFCDDKCRDQWATDKSYKRMV